MHLNKILFFLIIMFTNSKLFSFTEGTAHNDDVDIYFRDYGPPTGDPILLVQGLGGQLINWPEHLISFLIDNNFRPIVYDNRDTGLSSRIDSKMFSKENVNKTVRNNYIRYYLRLPIKSEYSLNDMASDGIAVLDKLRIEKAHILGISMGGMISQLIVSENPNRVKTFTLIASTAITPSPFNGPTRKVRNLLLERTKNTEPSTEQRIERTRKIFSEIGYQGIDLNTKEFDENITTSINRGGVDDTGFGKQITAILSSKNRIDKIKSIDTKTLIIHGKEDPLIKVRNAYKMNKLIKNSELIIISDMRHLIEEPIFDKFKYDLLSHLLTF